MTEFQLYLAIGMPTIAVLVGMLVNSNQVNTINGRMGAAIESRIAQSEARLDTRMASLENKFDLLVGKVIELDNRLTRLEERLKR